MSTKHSFTLTELIVVNVTLVILAVILFPACHKKRNARRTARSISCVSNMKQVGIAARIYGDDNKNTTVPSYQTQGTGYTYFPHYLKEYIGDQKTWACSAHKKYLQQNGTCTNQEKGIWAKEGIDTEICGINYKISQACPADGSNRYDKGISYGFIRNPSDTVAWACMCTDATHWGFGVYKQNCIGAATATMIGEFNEGDKAKDCRIGTKACLPHSGATNFTFIDGHVATLKNVTFAQMYMVYGK